MSLLFKGLYQLDDGFGREAGLDIQGRSILEEGHPQFLTGCAEGLDVFDLCFDFGEVLVSKDLCPITCWMARGLVPCSKQWVA